MKYLLIAMFVATPTFADDGEVVGKTHDGRDIVLPSDTVLHGSSEANRQNLAGSAVAEVGFGIGGILTSGLAAGYYLNPDNLVELSHISGEFDLSIVKIAGSLTSLRLKHWFGNSFYGNLGVGYRTIEAEASLDSILGTGTKESLKVTSIGIDGGIGNRWQWEYFTIGCDWIGYFVPLSSEGDTEIDDDNADEDDKKDLEDTAEKIGKSGSSQLLRFYMGVSF